jgi:transcriptional regulator with XRE-family HTH domain
LNITLENMGKILREKRGSRGMREVATEIEISVATLSRIESGKLPDIDTFTKICRWMGIDAGKVLGTKTEKLPQANLMPCVNWKADRNLSPKTAGALAELIIAANSFFAA